MEAWLRLSPSFIGTALGASEPAPVSHLDTHTTYLLSNALLPASLHTTLHWSFQREDGIVPLPALRSPRLPEGTCKVRRWYMRVCGVGRFMDPPLCDLLPTRRALFALFTY